MLSASLRKSVTDLSRRRARTVFTVLTLAIAVASISFFAIPTLIDRAMQDEVRAGRLADVTRAAAPARAHGRAARGVGRASERGRGRAALERRRARACR